MIPSACWTEVLKQPVKKRNTYVETNKKEATFDAVQSVLPCILSVRSENLILGLGPTKREKKKKNREKRTRAYAHRLCCL